MTEAEIEAEMNTTEFKLGHVLHEFQSVLSDLLSLAADGVGYDLIQRDIRELELAHAQLGSLLTVFNPSVQQAAE